MFNVRCSLFHMSANIAQRANARLTFTGYAPVRERLAACKDFLRTEMTSLRERHRAGAAGLTICNDRAQIIDALLIHLFDYALASFQETRGPLPAPVALLAVGGYGRSELSPWSDVDVMFLFPTKTKPSEAKPLQEHLTNEILYFLWDCGLKVGHSTRTIDDAFNAARRDIQTKTALLEARRIAGSEKLYHPFSHAYRLHYASD